MLLELIAIGPKTSRFRVGSFELFRSRCFWMISRFFLALWIAGAEMPMPIALTPAVTGSAPADTILVVLALLISLV